MKINVAELSDADLAALVAAAGAELARRLSEDDRIVRRPSPPQTVVVDEPDESSKDFVLYVAGLVKSGQYIKASERARIAAIAASYPAWVKMQGLPVSSNAGEWNRARSYLTARRACER